MRKFGLALAVGMLAAGTAAHAQTAGGISNITFSASSASGPCSDCSLSDLGYGAGTTGGTPGASFNSFVDVGPQLITFESANTTAAGNQYTTSSSQVSFKVTNNTGLAASFNSTITAAGLGFYLADTGADGGCLFSNCPQVQPGGATFANLPGLNTLARVGFDFNVTSTTLNSDGGIISDPFSLYHVSGSLGVGHDGTPLYLNDQLGSGGFCSFDFCGDPTGPRGLLDNFRTTLGTDYAGDANSMTAIGFAWDATDIQFGIGASQYQILTYTTTVYSESGTGCFGSACLIAYAGFGDPVGASGAVDNAARFALDSFTQADDPQGGLIGGLHFAPTTFAVPSFDGSEGSFSTAPLPEPASWAMMIAGFGLLGAALRRRRVLAYN